jgi:hypothetical protein
MDVAATDLFSYLSSGRNGKINHHFPYALFLVIQVSSQQISFTLFTLSSSAEPLSNAATFGIPMALQAAALGRILNWP